MDARWKPDADGRWMTEADGILLTLVHDLAGRWYWAATTESGDLIGQGSIPTFAAASAAALAAAGVGVGADASSP